MVKLNRAICEQCRKVFVPEKPEQKFCSFLCDCHYNKITAPGSKIKKLNCLNCQKKFYHWNKRKFCSEICKEDYKNLKKTDEEKNKTQNKLWLENNCATERLSRAHKNKIPYHVLNKIKEKERVYGKKAWNHYCKGRKWDRI